MAPYRVEGLGAWWDRAKNTRHLENATRRRDNLDLHYNARPVVKSYEDRGERGHRVAWEDDDDQEFRPSC
jgi:hypothetical protein